jgi:hypothetical protein
MLGKLLNFRRSRTLSRYADDKAVQDFEKVAKEQKLDLDYNLGKRLDEMAAAPPEETEARLAEIAEFLGQTDPNKGKW